MLLVIDKKVPECVRFIINFLWWESFSTFSKTLNMIREVIWVYLAKRNLIFPLPPDKQWPSCPTKWVPIMLRNGSGKSHGEKKFSRCQKGRKRNEFLVLTWVPAQMPLAISPTVFGLRKRVVKFGSQWDSPCSPAWKSPTWVESSEWAVYVLRWLRFSLQKNACLGASPTPAPALFPWPGPMSPPMVGVGGAVSTPWKCPSVPSSFQTSPCTVKTFAAS